MKIVAIFVLLLITGKCSNGHCFSTCLGLANCSGECLEKVNQCG